MKRIMVKRETCGCEAAPFCQHAKNATPVSAPVPAPGQNITIQGKQIFINVPISWAEKAVKFSNGRIRLVTPEALKYFKNPDSYLLRKDPGAKFGEQFAHGHATVVVSLDNIQLLGLASSRNSSNKSRLGPAKAQFFGTKQFNEEKANTETTEK